MPKTISEVGDFQGIFFDAALMEPGHWRPRRSARVDLKCELDRVALGPAAVEVERLTIDWIKQILGFDEHAAGLFVSGGSMANMAALAAARRAKAPEDLMNKGAGSIVKPMYA